MNANQKYVTRVKPKSYIGYSKKKGKKKGGIIFFCNVGKMFVSDTPCPWQKYCRQYQKLAFCSKF